MASKSGPTPATATRQNRADKIAELAAKSASSRDIAATIGVRFETVRKICRDFEIDVPADKAIGRTRRADSNRIIETTVSSLEGLVRGLDFVKFDSLDRSELPDWIDGLRTGETRIRRLRGRLEALLDESDRRCPVCGAVVTGRADRVYCGGTCRQRARRTRGGRSHLPLA